MTRPTFVLFFSFRNTIAYESHSGSTERSAGSGFSQECDNLPTLGPVGEDNVSCKVLWGKECIYRLSELHMIRLRFESSLSSVNFDVLDVF